MIEPGHCTFITNSSSPKFGLQTVADLYLTCVLEWLKTAAADTFTGLFPDHYLLAQPLFITLEIELDPLSEGLRVLHSCPAEIFVNLRPRAHLDQPRKIVAGQLAH